jgi:hypothetical protein
MSKRVSNKKGIRKQPARSYKNVQRVASRLWMRAQQLAAAERREQQAREAEAAGKELQEAMKDIEA